MICDVNVLVAALRADHPGHLVAREAIDRARGARRPLGVPDHVLVSAVRIATHPRGYAEPTSLVEALAFAAAVRAQPGYDRCAAPSGLWERFATLVTATEACGNDLPDAYLAALAIALGRPLVSLDRDFARFPGLAWVDPADPAALVTL